MTWLVACWRRLKGVFVKEPLAVVVRVASMSDVPEDLGDHIFIVGDQWHPKWAILACPCPHGERIDVNLMKSRYPYWTVKERNGLVSLSPSLWMPKEACGSHFWLVENRAVWASDPDMQGKGDEGRGER